MNKFFTSLLVLNIVLLEVFFLFIVYNIDILALDDTMQYLLLSKHESFEASFLFYLFNFLWLLKEQTILNIFYIINILLFFYTIYFIKIYNKSFKDFKTSDSRE